MVDYDASNDPNYVDDLLIGMISFSDNESINEQEISNKNNRPNFGKRVGECKIELYGGEGAIPHFHINGVNSNFKSCVCIYSNNYFSHGGKYTSTLNSTQREELDRWLSAYNDKLTLYTNWELMGMLWDISNPDCKFPNSRKCSTKPDYTKMKDYKDK